MIANQLAASKTFHCLAELTPPDDFLSELQQRLVDFVWSNKRHRLKKRIMYQRPDKGGSALSTSRHELSPLDYHLFFVTSKVTLITLFDFLQYHLRRYKKLNYDFQLFYMKTDPLFDIGMPSFYGEIMRARRLSGARLEIIHNSVSHVLNLPFN